MKVYITKYSLTQGIFEAEVDTCDDNVNMVSDRSSIWLYYHGNDWHKTKESAIAQAEQMRLRKIASLKKQIAKLRELRFE